VLKNAPARFFAKLIGGQPEEFAEKFPDARDTPQAQ